ncbi:hypothetical protein AJ79_00875 [Helicocarpus griseus UAMH5409]|uniref:G domain-containing protein n=1 Tax=Helicocarpus griseus UAMH5409 TaxID=1447875 RepID=A0A2B7Y0Y7_9EURO|nr:hypothetical protein AJ79_00875 [Helicocarpus griseus UAMH5409]
MFDDPGPPVPAFSAPPRAENQINVKLEEDGDTSPHNLNQIADAIPGDTFQSEHNTRALTESLAIGTGDHIVLPEVKPEKHSLFIPPQTRYIHRNSSIENLEIGVSEGLQFLDPLKDLLQKYSPEHQGNKWFKEVEDLKKKVVPPKVIIGVVGTTGAGKSSLINAILDEERSADK